MPETITLPACFVRDILVATNQSGPAPTSVHFKIPMAGDCVSERRPGFEECYQDRVHFVFYALPEYTIKVMRITNNLWTSDTGEVEIAQFPTLASAIAARVMRDPRTKSLDDALQALSRKVQDFNDAAAHHATTGE